MLYLVNKNAQIETGDHKIHKITCKRKPKDINVIKLKDVYDSKVALCEAKKYFFNVDGCKYCCPEIYLEKIKRNRHLIILKK